MENSRHKIKFGLETYSYRMAFNPEFNPQPMDMFSFLERVSELNLQGAQIESNHLASKDREYLHRVAETAKSYGLYLEVCANSTEVEHLREMLNVASNLDARVVRVMVGSAGDRFSKERPWKNRLDEAVKSLREGVKHAEQSGIILALENHQDLTSLEVLNILAQVGSPYLRACYDVANPLVVGEDPITAAYNLCPVAVTCHFEDYAIELAHYGLRFVGRALGEGLTPLAEIAKIIKKLAPSIMINIVLPLEEKTDPASTLAYEQECVVKSIKYVHEIFK